jgi:hypothetical protein
MMPNISATGQSGLPLPVSSASSSIQPLQDTPRNSVQAQPAVIVNIRSSSVDIAAAEQAQPQGVTAGNVRSVEASGEVSTVENALEQTADRSVNRRAEERSADRRVDEQREVLANRSEEVLSRREVVDNPVLTAEIENRAVAEQDIASTDTAAVVANRAPGNASDIVASGATVNRQTQGNDIASANAPASETARLARQNDLETRSVTADTLENRTANSRDISSADAASFARDRLAQQNNIASRSAAVTATENRQESARDLASDTVENGAQLDNTPEINTAVAGNPASLQSPVLNNGLLGELASTRSRVTTAGAPQAISSENSVEKAVEVARKQSLAAFEQTASATGVVNNGGAGTNVDLHV